MAMFGAASFEQPVPCVLDAHDVDRLLVRLHAVHGKPCYQGAMALNAVSVAEDPDRQAAIAAVVRLEQRRAAGSRLPRANYAI